MSPGAFARRVLGDRLFARAARAYRGFFLDLDAAASCFPPLPPGRELLDVGGGDGELLNRILLRNPGVRASMIDLSSRVGVALLPELRERVAIHPATSLAAYRALGRARPDVVFLSDVVHHVPPPERERFFAELRALDPVRLVVKEFAPGHWKSPLGRLADRYVSGDRNVRLLGAPELCRLVAKSFPGLLAHETPLARLDPPNYCIVFSADG